MCLSGTLFTPYVGEERAVFGGLTVTEEEWMDYPNPEKHSADPELMLESTPRPLLCRRYRRFLILGRVGEWKLGPFP